MKKALFGCLCFALAATFTGCGSGGGEAVDTAPPVSPMDETPSPSIEGSAPIVIEEPAAGEPAPVEEVAPVEEAAPAEDPSPAEEAAPAEGVEPQAAVQAAPMTDGLTGSKWTYNEIELEFREDGKVHLKGGPVAALAPDGLEAPYTLADGNLSVDVFGQAYAGTWDGSVLQIAGENATKVQ
jgi:hypothetical protein